MQETNVYTYLTPIALLFIMLEIVACRWTRRELISFPEAIANFGTALANQTTNVLVMVGSYYTYGWLYDNFRLATIELNWLTFILLLLGVDFIFYWVHRWGHAINIMWAAHSPHHSAEEMNFFVAVRASVTQRLCSFLFFWPLTLIGFHPAHIYMMSAVHLFIAFLHHTEFIPKLWRPVELIFTTPSHHRVHHGVNFKYLDKNFGEFLIIWDRLFGSFAEEKEKVVYGIYDHPRSWNPVKINFHFYIVLWKLAVAAPFWWDKARIWFMPPGWRPRGLEAPDKIEITTANQRRFRPAMFAGAKLYLALQGALGILLMLGVVSNLYGWSAAEKWLAAALLWWQIINWSGILEAKNWLCVSEVLRNAVTPFAVIWFCDLYQPSFSLFALLAASAACAVWTLLYFRPASPTVATA
jgi:sterol desaturase/sphingolipid hydroxylase (fatty acid hydroxylase superfamily)